MARPKHILVVVDLSERCRTAIRYALALTEHFGARMDVLMDEPGEPVSCQLPGRPVAVEGARARQAVRLARLLEELSAVMARSLPSQPVTVEVGVGGELPRRAGAGVYDLVILGRHGTPRLSDAAS